MTPSETGSGRLTIHLVPSLFSLMFISLLLELYKKPRREYVVKLAVCANLEQCFTNWAGSHQNWERTLARWRNSN